MEFKKHPKFFINHILSAFFIYPMILPLLILDFCLEIYHNVSFRLYGLPLVCRANYVRIDRHKLSYLGIMTKMNCVYCGYANGLLAYAVKIAGDTEKYWCGIKHQAVEGYIEPKHHSDFLAYGDELAYRQIDRKKICKLSTESSVAKAMAGKKI